MWTQMKEIHLHVPHATWEVLICCVLSSHVAWGSWGWRKLNRTLCTVGPAGDEFRWCEPTSHSSMPSLCQQDTTGICICTQFSHPVCLLGWIMTYKQHPAPAWPCPLVLQCPFQPSHSVLLPHRHRVLLLPQPPLSWPQPCPLACMRCPSTPSHSVLRNCFDICDSWYTSSHWRRWVSFDICDMVTHNGFLHSYDDIIN